MLRRFPTRRDPIFRRTAVIGKCVGSADRLGREANLNRGRGLLKRKHGTLGGQKVRYGTFPIICDLPPTRLCLRQVIDRVAHGCLDVQHVRLATYLKGQIEQYAPSGHHSHQREPIRRTVVHIEPGEPAHQHDTLFIDSIG